MTARRQAMPTVVLTKDSAARKGERVVEFPTEPVTSMSRPVNEEENWALHNFESHARACVYCHDPYDVHKSHRQLCETGHKLAQKVARYIYNKADGHTYSTVEEEDSQLVRVEIPAGYVEVQGLLKAIERSLRHRRREPFVSMDRTYPIPLRVPRYSQAPKIEHHAKERRPRSGEVVGWPEDSRATATIEVSKRGSLYAADIAQQRRDSVRYNVEIREPSRRDIREHRHSGYYR